MFFAHTFGAIATIMHLCLGRRKLTSCAKNAQMGGSRNCALLENPAPGGVDLRRRSPHVEKVPKKYSILAQLHVSKGLPNAPFFVYVLRWLPFLRYFRAIQKSTGCSPSADPVNFCASLQFDEVGRLPRPVLPFPGRTVFNGVHRKQII